MKREFEILNKPLRLCVSAVKSIVHRPSSVVQFHLPHLKKCPRHPVARPASSHFKPSTRSTRPAIRSRRCLSVTLKSRPRRARELSSSLDADGRAFATMLVEGVLANRDELDRIIVGSAPNWPIDQMSRIDKGILRLAIFEILFDNKVPLKAAINEAVELGKRFGSDSSSRFINGVLGTIADMRQAQGRRKPQKNGEHQPAGAKSAIQNPQPEIVE